MEPKASPADSIKDRTNGGTESPKTKYVAVLLAIGAVFGWAQARQETERGSDDLSVRYVRSVAPYQAPR